MIGQSFQPITPLSAEQRKQLEGQILTIVPSLRKILSCLREDELRTPYRPGGWTPLQIVHHMADNDMNAYLRLKRALTEDEPVANSYREDLWAELSDYSETSADISITLMECLHSRLYQLLQGLNAEDYVRKLRTEVLGTITIEIAVQRFIWHNQNHLRQIAAVTRHVE